MADLISSLAARSAEAPLPGLLQMVLSGLGAVPFGGGARGMPQGAASTSQRGASMPQGGGPTGDTDVIPGLAAMSGNRPDGSSWQPDRWKAVPWRKPDDPSYDSGLPDYYNPANWGPPPAYVEGGYSGFFPGVFGKSDPNGKYWTMKDYMAQAPKKEGVVYDEDDYSPNTLNPNLISNPASRAVRGDDPGFMYKQGSFSRRQIGEDLQQGQNPPAGAEGGGNRPPIRGTTRYGSPMAAFNYGGQTMLGLPGLLGQWTTSY